MALFGVVGGIGAAISVPASGWISKAPESLPALEQKLQFLNGPLHAIENGMKKLQGLMDRTGAAPPKGTRVVAVQQSGTSGLTSVGSSILIGTRAFLGQLFSMLLMLFFLLSSGDSLLHRLVEVLPSFADKRCAVAIAREIEGNISGYLATITVMNLLVGVLNGLQVWLFGMGAPLLWGTVAFLLNYIPILGPLTGVVIFLVVGLLSFSSPLFALVPAGVYLLIHIMEGETITPMLLARRFTLNPLLVILSLFFWDWLWGVPGAFLSVPLLAVFKIFCDHIESLTPIGHMLGESHARPRKG